MNILIDKNQILEYTVNGKYEINEQSQNLKFKTSQDCNAQLTIYYVDRDFDNMSRIIEDCSIINSVNGKPLLRASTFIRKIVLTFVKRIKLKTENKEIDIIVNNENIDRMHYDFVKFISKKWLELTNRI